ncbi:hypothetical protein KIN20_017552 [Parelaphostrongylus tenuis]|uniref:SAM domain-containing protein n=1 Tax=Parelaphostrongylus tenuis TaxID=148309 RepID=A0AAD5N2N8_PARTN|nr:hypothetical protein KIN20_017552 [Parelaphostrongylus tenuis]
MINLLYKNVKARTISSASASPSYQRQYVGVENVISYVPPEPEMTVEPKAHMAVAKQNQETHALVAELNETIGKKTGEALRKPGSRTPTISIHENSTPDEVSLWLQKKSFSPRVIELLEGQDGANLFALNKESLMQACGREEGTRLYSQLLAQKHQSNVGVSPPGIGGAERRRTTYEPGKAKQACLVVQGAIPYLIRDSK